MVTISETQATWLIDNILLIAPATLFIFTSLVIGFWKLIGKLFCKIRHKEKVNSPQVVPLTKPQLIQPRTNEPVDTFQVRRKPVVEDGYLDLTQLNTK